MRKISIVILLFMLLDGTKLAIAQSESSAKEIENSHFPAGLVNFTSYEKNPLLSGSGTNTWDQVMRERGWILKEDGMYYMWYTGNSFKDGKPAESHLGYATSADGLKWTKYKNNPVYDAGWVEDMCVVKSKGTYYMFAEGKDDIAHMLTSVDRINWKENGPLDIRYSNGEPLSKGPYGTPAVWLENDIWYLFYERGDLGVWLATSTDLKVWTNLQDEAVINIGPELYDKYGLAVDQVIKYKGSYYAYYHATADKDWNEWSSCVAESDDLIHWEKYSGNPIMRKNKSSPILIYNGEVYLLYTMNDEVCVHFPKK